MSETLPGKTKTETGRRGARAAVTARYLRTIRNTICHELYDDLGGQARDSADAAVRLLNRLIADQEEAQREAEERLPAWRQLGDDLEAMLDLPAEDRADEWASGEQLRAGDLIERMQSRLIAEHRIGDIDTRGPWFRKTVEALAALNGASEAEIAPPLTIERAFAAPAASTNIAEPEVIQKKLSTYLSARFPDLGDDPIISLSLLPGGNTKLTAFVGLKPTAVLPATFVLKCDMGSGHTGTTVLTEYPALRAAYDAGVPVPEPILAEPDASVIGGPFVLMTAIGGGKQMIRTTPEVNRWRPHSFLPVTPEFGDDMARAMGRLHNISDLPGAAGEPQTAAWTHKTVEQYHERWQALDKSRASLATDLCFAWLLANPLPADRPLRLIHGDLGGHNVLVRDGRLAAILDWELAALGDPSEDIGYARMNLIDPILDWDRFQHVYLANGGDPRALDAHAVHYFAIWTYVRVSTWCAMIGHDYWRGNRDDINGAMNAWDTESRNQEMLSRALLAAIDSQKQA